jgi:3-oxoacyl-[acyl-carrier protein] reductase
MTNNLHSAFYVLRSAARVILKSGGNSIVLISSAAAQVGLANHETIGAAKAGIIGLALSAEATYASKNSGDNKPGVFSSEII